MKINIIYILKGLTKKKSRSFLTILSIAIGIGSVLVVSAISDIGRSAVNYELESLGIGSVLIDTQNSTTSTIHSDALAQIKDTESVAAASPVTIRYGNAKIRGETQKITIWGVDEAAESIINMKVKYGRGLRKQDIISDKKVCLIDEATARIAYQRANIVGKTIELLIGSSYETFEIAGIVESGSSILQGIAGEYLPSFVYVPYTAFRQPGEGSGVQQIAVKFHDAYDITEEAEKIVSDLSHAQGSNSVQNPTRYKYENLAQHKDTLNNMFNIVSLILSAIAGISLLVAGLGIMTIMLVAVNERTREIGIKKAIGAKSGQIMAEFLLEALILSLAGCIVGCIVGLLLAALIAIITQVEFMINWRMLFICLGFSVITALAFGVYPARAAAKLQPLEALRRE